jgi:predicted nucleic acid-binding Zn ribbon protein
MKLEYEETFIKSMPSDESLMLAWDREIMERDQRDHAQVNFIFYLLVAMGGLMAAIGIICTVIWVSRKLVPFLLTLFNL